MQRIEGELFCYLLPTDPHREIEWVTVSRKWPQTELAKHQPLKGELFCVQVLVADRSSQGKRMGHCLTETATKRMGKTPNRGNKKLVKF